MLSTAINNTLKEYAAVLSLLTFLMGLLLGNWLAVTRDRRKEFIEVAQRVRQNLLAERSKKSPYSSRMTEVDVDLLDRMFYWRLTRHRFRKAIARYQAAHQDTEQDASGQVHYRNPNMIVAAIDDILRFTEPR